MNSDERFSLVYSANFERVMRRIKKKKPDVVRELLSQFPKLAHDPELGKPLRHSLRKYRRMHLGSFVLLYEIRSREVHLIDFDHHDKIYKKY